jgi:hypothetical protein
MMIKGILHHTLKGIRGWSLLETTNIDVAKVSEICCGKRLFMLFDRNYPYVLRIQYEEPARYFTTTPVIGGRGFAISTDTVTHQIITKRYMTERDAKQEMDEILAKQAVLKTYAEQEENKLLQKMDEFCKNN